MGHMFKYIMYFCNQINYSWMDMDALSLELQEFLVRLGRNPECVSEKVEHYIKHILHLLNVEDERIMIRHYGLFGQKQTPVEALAAEYGMSADEVLLVIGKSLRRLAVTPEWQMIKQFAGSSLS